MLCVSGPATVLGLEYDTSIANALGVGRLLHVWLATLVTQAGRNVNLQSRTKSFFKGNIVAVARPQVPKHLVIMYYSELTCIT